MTGRVQIGCNATDWRSLANELLFAIDQLEAINRNAALPVITRAILVSIADDLQSLNLDWCAPNGSAATISEHAIRMRLVHLPAITDITREDGALPANASIDRAVSKVAAAMLSWTKDPETFELVQRQRYQLFLRWPGGKPALVDEYAYGLWDE